MSPSAVSAVVRQHPAPMLYRTVPVGTKARIVGENTALAPHLPSRHYTRNARQWHQVSHWTGSLFDSSGCRQQRMLNYRDTQRYRELVLARTRTDMRARRELDSSASRLGSAAFLDTILQEGVIPACLLDTKGQGGMLDIQRRESRRRVNDFANSKWAQLHGCAGLSRREQVEDCPGKRVSKKLMRAARAGLGYCTAELRRSQERGGPKSGHGR
ncbi:hypothetical protein B0J13DRAFT_527691 [Dactylonectria estremocensis]|uniref:Uncharacterized protein n=1 Tax=Dactylonectria estremocensis TaxID=1079267 RepID=A0A9P9EMZ8_9HYPO|nr:hypothetical protein B0J13DRAFT_527691 [Dactylonectria estremocensis]